MKFQLLLVCALAAGLLVQAKPKPAVKDNSGRVVCYYGSWAVYRPGLGKFDVEQIDPYICTHVIYAFAGLDPTTYTIKSLDPYNDLYDNYGKGAYQRFTGLANTNPDLKCILAIGGWNENPVTYSTMANDPALRATFVASVVPFLQAYGFHGLDVDWEYPDQRGGQSGDKQAFTSLLSDLRTSFEPYGFLLSAALSANQETIDNGYEVTEIIKYIDYLNIMTYDFHGPWETFTGHNAPLHPRPDETADEQLLNDDFGINYWISQGAPAGQINIGLAEYGHSYTLADPNVNGLYATTSGPGTAGPYTGTAGTLGYNEMCVNLNSGGWTTVVDPYYLAPYSYLGNQWVSYDDTDSIAQKCEWALTLNVGGGMIWSIETDDFQPSCSSQKFPLLTVVNQYFRGTYSTPPPVTTTPYTGPSTTATTTTTTTKPAPPPSDVCQYPGFQADPNDCTTFYNCVVDPATGGWDVYTFHCAAGTVFDPSIDSCNYPEDVPDCHADI